LNKKKTEDELITEAVFAKWHVRWEAATSAAEQRTAAEWKTRLQEHLNYIQMNAATQRTAMALALALMRTVTAATPPQHTGIRLLFCEKVVAIIAPKGRIDEFLGDHAEELEGLVRQFGLRQGAWICRLRLAGTVLHMLPAKIMRFGQIATRIAVLWRLIGG
jgi:hypothetical protein